MIRYNRISIRPTVSDSFTFFDVNGIVFSKDAYGRDYYVIKEYELGVVADYEQFPTRCIEIGKRGDYLFRDQLGNLKIIEEAKLNRL